MEGRDHLGKSGFNERIMLQFVLKIEEWRLLGCYAV
jgi:hypothetical protein